MKKIIFAIFAIVLVIGFYIIQTKPSSIGETSPTTEKKEEGKMVSGYNGKVLAGSSAPYLIFDRKDYDKALASGKIVFLDFFANWCPICRAEAPDLKAGFDALKTDKVIGFRVNYNDSDTDADEKALAKQFNIPYQHTKVILKDGNQVLKNGESWDKERFLQEVNNVL